jgi:hypothetical protein
VINVARYWEPRFDETQHHEEYYQSLFYKILQEGMIYGLVVYGLPISFLIWLNYYSIRIIWFDNVSLSSNNISVFKGRIPS